MAAMGTQFVRRHPSLLTIAGLAVLSALFWADCLFGPHTPLAAGFQAEMEPWRTELDLARPQAQWRPLLWDGVAQFYPWRLFAARQMRQGTVALWNPHQLCGYPFLANGQSALLYPPNWLLALVDVRWGMGLLAALHYFLASGLTYLFARRIGLGHLAAAFGGIAFAYGGFMVSWTELPTLMNVATWLPGALLGIALIFERSRWGVPVLAGALALTLLAGHFQIAAYVWLAALGYAAARALWEGVNRRPWFPASLAAAFLLGAIVGSAQVIPSLELGLNSTRGAGQPTEAGFEFHRSRALQSDELPALVRPNLFGNPAHGDHVLVRYGLPYAEHCGFVGIITVILALAGIAFARTRHYALFLILTAAALNVAMCGPLARAMFYGIPKLGLAGGFTRVLSIYTFAMAMAAAAGLDALCRRIRARGKASVGDRGRRRWSLRGATGLCVLSAAVLLAELLPWGHEYLPKTRREHVYPMTPTIERLIQSQGRVLAITPRDRWGLLRTPQAVLPPNSATVFGYDSISGYDSLFPRSYRRFVNQAEGREPAPLANGNLLLPENAGDPLYAVAGLTTVAAMPYGEAGRGVDIDVLEDALPRAFVVPDGPRWDGVLTDLLSRVQPVTDASDLALNVSACGLRREGPANMLVRGLGAEGPAPWLVVTETFYPGWSAYVGGRRRELLSVGRTFCGVPLRGGEGEVRLVFEPFSVRLGLFLGLTGIGALAGLIVFRRESIPWI